MRAKLTRRHVGRMAHLRLVLLLALLASCGVTPRLGEFGKCYNQMDDDNDGLKDCRDPDCFSDEACRVGTDSGGSAGSRAMDSGAAGHDAGKGDASTGGTDAGKPDASARDGGKTDAGSPPDAGVMIDDSDGGALTCSPACSETEQCVLAMDAGTRCEAVAAKASGTFTLTILSATAPDVSVGDMCLDKDCPPPPAYGFCPSFCHVDPYVRAVLVHEGSETIITTTTAAANTLDVSYSDGPSMSFSLAAGDVVRFEVLDSNLPPNSDLLLYDCKPDLSMIPGPLSCTAFEGLGGILPVTVTAELDAVP